MKVGFIGLGNVGTPIARDLATGHDLTVFDVRREATEEFRKLGAHAAASPAEVAVRSDVIGVCVRSDDQALDVLRGPDGVLANARPGTLLAIHSTIHMPTLTAIVEETKANGLRVVDAPVTRGAATTDMIKATVFMLGGEPEDVARASDYVAPASKETIVAGGLGSALILKLCNNVITYQNMVMQRDLIALANAYHLDLAKLAELISVNGNGNAVVVANLKRMANAGPDAHHALHFRNPQTADATAGLGEKDLSAAVEAAKAAGLAMPVAEFALANIRSALVDA